MDSTHAPVEMLIYVWKVLSLPFASVPLTWLSLFLFIFPVEGEDFCYVTNFANPRHIRVLYLEFSDFLYFLICSIFSLRFEIQRLIPPSLVRWQKENCASCSLIQKAVGIVFFFWNTFFFLQIFPCHLAMDNAGDVWHPQHLYQRCCFFQSCPPQHSLGMRDFLHERVA